MNNRLIEIACNNFQSCGYSLTRIESEGECRMLIPYKINNGILHAVALVDFENGDEWTSEEYHNVLRSFKNYVYKDDVSQINILQVIFTNKSECVGDLGVEFSPYWIVNMNSQVLMVYENQPVKYMDARKIIEDAVDGTQYAGNGSRSFFSRGKKSFPVFTAILVIINIIVFAFLELTGSTEDVAFMLKHGALSYSETIYGGQYYRILTHFFMHFGIEHLFNNIIVLLVLGYHLENAIRKWWFIVIYMSSGIVSGIASMWWYYYIGEDCVSVGASGAIFGIIGALVALIIVKRGKFDDIGYGRMFMFLILTLFSGFQNADIDNAAHISGFVFGMIMMFVILAGKHFGLKYRKGNENQ